MGLWHLNGCSRRAPFLSLVSHSSPLSFSSLFISTCPGTCIPWTFPFRSFYRSLHFFFVGRNIKKKFVLFWLRLIVKRASPGCLKIEQRYPHDRSLTNGWRGLRTDIYPPDCHITDGWRYPAFEQLVPGIDHYHFQNLSGSHLQNQGKSVCQAMVSGPLKIIGQLI